MGVSCGKSPAARPDPTKLRLDSEFGDGTAQAVQNISDMLVEVYKELNDDRQMVHPMFTNLSMIFKQVVREHRYQKPLTSGSKFTDHRTMKKVARYAKYASAAQSTDKRGIANYIGAMQADDIKYVHSSPVCCTNFFVALDPKTGEVVLCLRGTPTAVEALLDVVSTKEPFLGGRAHSGVLLTARHVAENARGLLVKLLQHSPLVDLAIVGHSLGGGTAILLTMLLSQDESFFGGMMKAGKIRCYAFAPPPTFEPPSAVPRLVHDSTYSFVHNMDCIPRICLGTVSKLLLAVQQVDALQMSTEERLALLMDDSQVEQWLPDFVEMPQDYLVKLGTLFGVGTLVLLFAGDSGGTHCEKITPQMADRILMSPTMAEDHSMASYERAVADACMQIIPSRGCW